MTAYKSTSGLLANGRILLYPVGYESAKGSKVPLIRNNNEQSFRIWYQAGESPLPAVGTKAYDPPVLALILYRKATTCIFSLTGPDSTEL
ncbi:hypothetical protein APT61_05495 [Leclercia adecarboxylata]|nr:hypothetical protein APT61_05495 [Leclercia adecarboxylata]